MNSSSEQRLIEQMHSLDVALRKLEVTVRYQAEAIGELHADVKRLLGFKASLLGWASALSLIISTTFALLVAWWKH